MESATSEELVFVSTADGLRLEGVAIRPTTGAQQPARPPTIVLIHGNAASFCAPPYVTLGRRLAALGYSVVIGNTRGHDIATMLWRADAGMPTGGGAAWERLEDAPLDLAAWVEFAATRAADGGYRVVLAGHSSGAQRVALYQAERQDARVVGLALASPDLRGFFPPGEVAAAQRLVAEGRGLEVTPAQPFAPWYRQSAQTVVSKAAILSRLLDADDGDPTIATIHTPLFAFYGADEPRAAQTLETIREQARAAVRVDTEIIAGADHFYTGREADVAAAIARWAAALS